MIRTAHRTALAKLLAACLLLLAASPVNAPFTTIELTDLAHPMPVHLPHHRPGSQMAEAHVKVAPHVAAAAPALAPVLVAFASSRPLTIDVVTVAPTRGDLRVVLRL